MGGHPDDIIEQKKSSQFPLTKKQYRYRIVSASLCALKKSAYSLDLYRYAYCFFLNGLFFRLYLQLLSEEEKSAKLHRDVQFERRMHEELKSKHKHLQTVETDLSEEYVNLKLNYQRLKSDMEGQVL